MNFQPDYHNVLNAARNRESARLPLYEHIISQNKMAEIIGYDFTPLWNGDERDLNEYFRRYCGFFRDHGYDTVSFECCIGGIFRAGAPWAIRDWIRRSRRWRIFSPIPGMNCATAISRNTAIFPRSARQYARRNEGRRRSRKRRL